MTQPDQPFEDQHFNPYAAPQTTDLGTSFADSPAEELRRYHLNHETSVRSFSLLYFIGFLFCMVVAVSGFFSVRNQALAGGNLSVLFLMIYTALGVFQLLVGIGLRRLTTFGRVGGTILGVMGLIAFPIGSIVSAYLLYLLWSQKGSVVFSQRYRDVIDQTPHIKYRTSLLVWIALIFLLAVITVGIGSLIFSRV